MARAIASLTVTWAGCAGREVGRARAAQCTLERENEKGAAGWGREKKRDEKTKKRKKTENRGDVADRVRARLQPNGWVLLGYKREKNWAGVGPGCGDRGTVIAAVAGRVVNRNISTRAEEKTKKSSLAHFNSFH